ncbi:unnamed protein product [Brassicogethes aeneus]|uniref:Uncharacterized protein n=1 Tax=Brassicogethes aeneus TaxID=1431903 RepID=A0A9P0BCF4_BRAAE|nr:unnamed protein product [Brassicogethes aeneus]
MEARSIGEYINEYPALKSELESDFDQLYPDASMKMFSEWPGFCEKLLMHAQKRKDNILSKISGLDDENMTQEVRTTRILFLLPYLLSTHTLKRKRSQCWRPSKIEVEEGFIIHIKV